MGFLSCKDCWHCGYCRGTGVVQTRRGGVWCQFCGGHGRKLCLKHKKDPKSGRPCFVTTAVVNHLGKGDDCHELKVLRTFRDSYMLESAERAQMVAEYYRISPDLVVLIDRLCSVDSDFAIILYDTYISPSVRFVESGLPEEALLTYRSLVEFLASRHDWTAFNGRPEGGSSSIL
jgi:hypothetical protein